MPFAYLKSKRLPKRKLRHHANKKTEDGGKKNPLVSQMTDFLVIMLGVLLVMIAFGLAYDLFCNKPQFVPGSGTWADMAIAGIKSAIHEVLK